MSTFKFRAAAVLTLRRGLHEAAQAELVRRQQERSVAQQRCEDAERALESADADYRAALGTGGLAEELARHRNWIVRFTQDRDARRQSLDAQNTRANEALATERRAYRDVRIIERLRDRLARRHEAMVRRLDATAMDQLAVLQYARRMPGGLDCDH
jgi:flagellar biosynthesis chaperone FliJ